MPYSLRIMYSVGLCEGSLSENSWLICIRIGNTLELALQLLESSCSCHVGISDLASYVCAFSLINLYAFSPSFHPLLLLLHMTPECGFRFRNIYEVLRHQIEKGFDLYRKYVIQANTKVTIWVHTFISIKHFCVYSFYKLAKLSRLE